MFLLIVFLLVAISCIYFFYYKPKQTIHQFANKARQLNYKVLQLPFKFMSFSLLQFVQQDQRSLQIYKDKFKNYDIIVGNLFSNLAIVPVHTTILKDLFNQSIKMHKNPFFAEIFQILNGGGMAFAQGQVWKRKRRIISSVFHFDFLNHIIPLIEEETDNQLKFIDEKIQQGKNINLLNVFAKILSSIVAKCFFGGDPNEYKIQGKPYCEYYVDFLNQITYYGETYEHIFFGMKIYNLGLSAKSIKIKKKLQILRSVARQITINQLEKIKSKKQNSKNILTALYENNMFNEQGQQNHPQKYSIDELIGQFFVFFAAGTDTTANVLNLIFHYLSQHQFYVRKIEQQLNELSKHNANKAQQLKKMKWIEAVFNECLRINGPSPEIIPRVASQKIYAGGLQIPKNSSIGIYPLLNQYKEQNFEKPFEFIPQRWIQNVNLNPYTFIPFSSGQRNCIGQYLAKIEAKIIIQKIIKRYQFKSKKPIRMRSEFIYVTISSEFEMQIKNKNKINQLKE